MSDAVAQPASDTTAAVAAPAAPAAAPAPAPAAVAPVAAPAVAAPAPAPQAPAAPAVVAPVVPETYEFTAPEGVTFDPEVMKEFGGIAKDLKLSQDDAQGLVSKIAPLIAQRQQASFVKLTTDWKAAAAADPEIGGDKFEENLGIAKRAIDGYFEPEFGEFLRTTGLGNHPAMIKGLHKIGLTISEDGIIPGRQSSGAGKSIAETLYGGTK